MRLLGSNNISLEKSSIAPPEPRKSWNNKKIQKKYFLKKKIPSYDLTH